MINMHFLQAKDLLTDWYRQKNIKEKRSGKINEQQ